jgi:hypothetical protein
MTEVAAGFPCAERGRQSVRAVGVRACFALELAGTIDFCGFAQHAAECPVASR